MKKLIALIALLFLTTTAFAQITGSAHDFSSESWNSSGEICITCHTPHDAMTGYEPLWNHEVTASTFTLYSSSTLDATLGQPDGPSKLCLSCHDGTVALDNFGGTTTGTSFITGDALIGTDLSNDHPVSFTYDASLATTDGGLNDPTTTSSGLGGMIDADMLYSNKMQCASCHDVHNGAGIDNLLVKSNASSALCLTCHNK
ncbi:MAG: cytochrome c3 family protein [Chlorobi bacterium]|nr:cytochrome c3 family protein [Chlorobiota bacterium]